MAKGAVRERHSLEKRLLTYSVAAGAALAVAGPADAGVIYSGAKNITVNSGNPLVNVDINGDGANDFRFSYYLTSSWTTNSLFFESKGIRMGGAQSGNSAIGGNAHVISFFTFAPFLLSNGNDVSAGMAGTASMWSSAAGILNGIKYIGGYPNGAESGVEDGQMALGAGIAVPMGNFVGQRGFIGVRFRISGNTHYGWIEYEGSAVPQQPAASDGMAKLNNGVLPTVEGTIIGWAYEDVPERRITAGDLGQPAQPVPTLNEWGMIFLMGLILMEGARRLRKRSEKA